MPCFDVDYENRIKALRLALLEACALLGNVQVMYGIQSLEPTVKRLQDVLARDSEAS